MLAAITYGDLVAWSRYLKIRNAPARPWIRDADQIEAMAAYVYG